MKIKNNLILKEMIISTLNTLLISLVIAFLIPLITSIFFPDSFRDLNEYLPLLPSSVCSSILTILFIVLGALTLQYTRLQLLMGRTRKVSYWSVVLYNTIIIFSSAFVLLLLYLVPELITNGVSKNGIQSSIFISFYYLGLFFFAYGIGNICSSITTLVKPLVAIVICSLLVVIVLNIASLFQNEDFILFQLSFITNDESKVISSEIINNGDNSILSPISFIILGGFMILVASLNYKAKGSNIKSTSIN